MGTDFKEMRVYDFSNINLKEKSDNCFGCDTCDNERDCNICDQDCDCDNNIKKTKENKKCLTK